MVAEWCPAIPFAKVALQSAKSKMQCASLDGQLKLLLS